MSQRTDDMVITPELAGTNRGAASTPAGGQARPAFGARKRGGGLLRRVAKARALRRARSAVVAKGIRATGLSSAGRLLAKGGVPAAILAMVAVAVRLKSGKTFKQQGQALKNFAAGENLMKAAAALWAQQQIAGSINWLAYGRESQRAKASQFHLDSAGKGGIPPATDPKFWMQRESYGPTINRYARDLEPVFDRIRQDKFTEIRGLEEFMRRDRFASQSVADLLALEIGNGLGVLKRILLAVHKWARGY